MAGRVPLYTDADIHGPVVAALKLRGWDDVDVTDLARMIGRSPPRERDAKIASEVR
jgi:hypothetical protein